MDDDALLTGFSAATLAHTEFTHRAHIRVAYLLLRKYDLDEALARMGAGLQRLNAVHGTPHAVDRGYHATITRAWLQIVADTIAVHGPAESSDAFCDAQPHLMQRTLLRLYYTRDRIMTFEAKAAYVEPDIAPLPAPRDGK